MYLVDATVLWELRKPRRNANVVGWLADVPPDGLYLSVITIGEVARRITEQRRADPVDAASHAEGLQAWLEGLLADYSPRILTVDVAIATRWGRLCDAHPRLPIEMLLAATALDHDLTIATRNAERYRSSGVPVFNPFRRPSE